MVKKTAQTNDLSFSSFINQRFYNGLGLAKRFANFRSELSLSNAHQGIVFHRKNRRWTKTLTLIQVIMTFMMAVTMSGNMSLLALGPTALWLSEWPNAALIAWPFVFGTIAHPAASWITNFILKR